DSRAGGQRRPRHGGRPRAGTGPCGPPRFGWRRRHRPGHLRRHPHRRLSACHRRRPRRDRATGRGPRTAGRGAQGRRPGSRRPAGRRRRGRGRARPRADRRRQRRHRPDHGWLRRGRHVRRRDRRQPRRRVEHGEGGGAVDDRGRPRRFDRADQLHPGPQGHRRRRHGGHHRLRDQQARPGRADAFLRALARAVLDPREHGASDRRPDADDHQRRHAGAPAVDAGDLRPTGQPAPGPDGRVPGHQRRGRLPRLRLRPLSHRRDPARRRRVPRQM
ncbi:MAG: 3-oxoacyl-[acyl-carrier protein] reductase, partial [uncultured Thermomicrobiales bacterium]